MSSHSIVLFKKSKSGKPQKWKIEVEDNKYRTIEGYLDGALTPTEYTVCEGKSLGRSNETTANDQTLKEALARVQKQKDKGWTENLEDIEASQVKISPMLAKKVENYKSYIIGKLLIVQPKIDGIRCVATKDGLFTRNGKLITAVPHIKESLVNFFNEYPHILLDGELYQHSATDNFNQIISIVRKSKFTDEDLEKAKQIEYHIYDVDKGNDEGYLERTNLIKNWLALNNSPFLKLVSNTLTHHKDEKVLDEVLDRIHADYIEQNYEGLMARVEEDAYENCRSKSLLKMKNFLDDEFEIIDIEPGNGNRSAGAGRLICQLKDGRTFASNIRGTYEYYAELLNNKHLYIGKKATVRFQNFSEYGVPRFPVCIQIDRID